MSPMSVFPRFRTRSAGTRRPFGRLRLAVATLSAVVLMGIPPMVPAVQASSGTWYDGVPQYSTILNCIGEYPENGASAYVGYYADTSDDLPAPNTVYYIHVVVFGLGNACSGQYVWPEIALPSNTSLAISSTNPVYCYGDGTSSPAECPQSLSTSSYNPGSYAIPSTDPSHAYTWPLPQGWNWEFQIPVISTTALSGSMLTGHVWVMDGNDSPWLTPQEGIYVFGGTPTISYPSPSTTLIGTSTATSWGHLDNHGDLGTAYFDLGTTTSYGLASDSLAITGGNGWTLSDEWTYALKPNTLYHWRVRFHDTHGVTYSGADQTFKTLAAPSLSVSLTTSYVAGASHSVTVTARNANGTTNTGYRGTIRFTSSDTKAILPPNYTFTSGDSGVHTFSLGVKLKTAGTQWVRATDTGSATYTGAKTGIVVKPGGATHLTVTLTSSYAAGAAHTVKITVKDSYGNVATGYRGTIHFTSSDSKAVLPANHTFTSGDAGVHSFSLGVKLKTVGTQWVRATDTNKATITGVKTGIHVT